MRCSLPRASRGSPRAAVAPGLRVELGRSSAGFEAFEAGQVSCIRTQRFGCGAVYEPQPSLQTQERHHGQAGGEAGRSAGGQRVIGPGAVVAEDLGAARADEQCAATADAIGHPIRLYDVQLQVFQCDLPAHGDRLINTTAGVGLDLFHRFWQRLRVRVPQRVGGYWTGSGSTVFAVDGSRVATPRAQADERALGRAARHKNPPQGWITRLIHLLTKLLWDWRQGPGHGSERAHLRQRHPTLPPGSLLVADIGFGGFDLLADLSRHQASFLIRCGGNGTLLVDRTRQQMHQQPVPS